MNEHRIILGRRGLSAAMRGQIKPSRSDGLVAAGALRVGDHIVLTFLAMAEGMPR
jgi:hypothetical protein